MSAVVHSYFLMLSRVKSIIDNTEIKGLIFFPNQGAYIILSVNPRGI